MTKGFGLVRPKVEGAPTHPEDLDWEHYPDEGCAKCKAKWDAMLEAYNKWYREYFGKEPD